MIRRLALALALLASSLLAAAAAVAAPPNVVLIISDDQAWGDLGFMGHEHIQTPHLDRLASQSAVFTRGYTPTSLCRASLMTIITGQYPRQHLVTGNDPPRGTDRNLLLKHVRQASTLPKILGEQGYVSLQTGKWWEGNYAEGGFTAGMTHGDVTRRGRHGDEGLKIGREGLQPIYDFLESNRGKPFFLWYAPMMPHTPHNPPQRLLAKYQGKTDSLPIAKYWAMCEWWDETCGELLAHLDKQGLADNTLVIYVTDNGWIQQPDANGFAERSKRSPNEGGVRTPLMIRWPGKVQPQRDERTLVSTIDLAPTVLAACGIEPRKDLSGIDLLPVATGEKDSSRDAVFGEIYEHDIPDIDRAEPGLMFRWCIVGDWKLIESADRQTRELYNLKEDPHEHDNLATQQPERVRELSERIKQEWEARPPRQTTKA
jgi:arylsulfatase A-like enzyme